MPRAPMERTYLLKGGACSMVKRIEGCGKHKSRNPWGAAESSTLFSWKTTCGPVALWPCGPVACGLLA